MNLHKLYSTENECYKTATKITPVGIMVHSTGANNPYLKRYVGPNDGLLGINKYNNHVNNFRPDGRQICPAACIGKLENGDIATYQILPWDYQSWHSGSGSLLTARKNGFSCNSANRLGYIGFEICEDDLTDKTYCKKIFKEAAELCAYLCKMYGLNPETDIISHKEGHTLGIASGHVDPEHWWSKHGYTMNMFRKYVKQLMASETNKSNTKIYRIQVGAFANEANAKEFLKTVKKTFPNAYITS